MVNEELLELFKEIKEWIMEFNPSIEEKIVDDFLYAIKDNRAEIERFFFIMFTGIYYEI